jgi:hypothetical protein
MARVPGETTVTVASLVAPPLSVTRTVSDAADPGAVYRPVAEFIDPDAGGRTEKVYGLCPPIAEKVKVSLVRRVFDTGSITNACAGITDTEASLLFPKSSSARTTTVSDVEGAVYSPVLALMLPPPDTIEKL